MAITIREYRNTGEGLQIVREETVRSQRAAESRVRRWCREAGKEEGRDPLAHDPALLCEADTEFGYQWSLEWEACGEPGTILWESELSSLMG